MSSDDSNVSPIEQYLNELARELGSGKGFTPRLLTEAQDHLLTSADRYERDGLTRLDAEKAAIRSFGSPNEMAAALRTGSRNEVGDVSMLTPREDSMIEMEVSSVRVAKKEEVGDPGEAPSIAKSVMEVLRQKPEDLKNLKLLEVDEASEVVFVVLAEKKGDRSLPIFIGKFEGAAILFALRGVETARPMTHELFGRLIESLEGVTPSRVVIQRLAKGTFYAYLELTQSGKAVQIDARPSDAIAVAVRLGLPVFVNESDEELLGALVSIAA